MSADGIRNWDAYVARATRQHGDRLDLSEIPDRFLGFFQTGQRIKVRQYGREITGTVSVTTGWRPALLLIRRANSMGSSDLLDAETELVAVQWHGKYVSAGRLV